ncbi:HNH endonuclease signature motif containing protein [Actinomadura latina]|nr:HNH endonuclease signature motif containing protein [Actinomadura latina]
MPAPVVAAATSRQREWENREWFPPGPQLAICLSGGKNRLADLTDDELLQVAAAARRQTSWAQARELAAIAELTRRRTTDEDSGDPDYRILSARESVTEEVAAALTVTGNTAATLVHLAEQLTGPLARTADALEAGHIDMGKARVICDVTDRLPEETAGRIERAALEKASRQTTGQLRRRLKRIAQRLAPEAIEERRREAVRQRRLELWDTPSGTSDLALCDLAAEDAHAIYNKITAAAHGVKADGDPRLLSAIRADLATRLLHGIELPDAVRSLLARTQDDTGSGLPGADGGQTEAPPAPSLGAGPVGPAKPASGNVAVSLDGAVGGGAPSAPAVLSLRTGNVLEHDGESKAHRNSGPQPATGPASSHRDARSAGDEEARSADAPRADRTADDAPPSLGPRNEPGGDLSGDAGIAALADAVDRRLNHVRGRVHPRELPQAVRETAQRIHSQFADARDAACQGGDKVHGRPGYRPSAAMRREVEARHTTCVFPTCNQPSHRCDLDHTIPWRPGITCRCNLAPLCRRHHRLKQRPDWRLFQIWAGLLVWVTPSGAWYIVRPDRQ